MDQNVKLVLDLHREILVDYVKNGKIDASRMMAAKKALAVALTEARVLGKPTDQITELSVYVERLNDIAI